jgi:glycosyltransferase involved in cell wall biosynthesis
MPKLSIITINRNNSKGLEETIRGVISQTFTDFEYIIIDGASTDSSVDVIKKYESKISYWISEPDKGIFNAMNKGVARASGEYIQFSNSGDWFVNQEVLTNVFKNDSTEDILFGNIVKMIDGVGTLDKGIATSNVTFYHLFLGTINHPATFARRELFNKYGLFNEKYKYVNDWEWFLRVVGLADTSVRYLDLDISYFDMTGNSNNSYEYYETERIPILKELVPKRILTDYNSLYTHEVIRNTINKHFFSRIMFSVAYKTGKMLDKVFR